MQLVHKERKQKNFEDSSLDIKDPKPELKETSTFSVGAVTSDFFPFANRASFVAF